MYRYLHLATCASLILFAIVVAGGVMAVVPSVLERLSASRAQVSQVSACATSNRECFSEHELRVGTDVQPIDPGQVQISAAIGNPPEHSRSKQAAAVPDRPSESPGAAAPVQPSQIPGTAQPAEVAMPAPPPQITKSAPETKPHTAHAEEPVRARPGHEIKPRVSSLKKEARRERTAERRAHTALSTLHRFEASRRDIPLSAYAAEGPPRRVIIRPTSIQDFYYYSRPWE